jgi:hypothetical protein
MKFLKQFLVLLAGVLIGIAIAHPFGARAQDQKDPSHHEAGRVSMTPIYPGPTGKVTLFQSDRYLGFSCTQTQCYVASIE